MTSMLQHYISHYQHEDNPGYAVLVTGSWGVGKTFQVKFCLNRCQYWYVSLFGRSSTTEIHDAVLAQIFPIAVKSSSRLAIFDGVAQSFLRVKDLGSTLGGVIRASLQSRIKPERILIFDDLERCNLPMKDLLGVLNHYIEHLGFRVILICDEAHLSPCFSEMQEKIVGHTIQIIPQIDSAFSAFLLEVNDSEIRAFLQEYKLDIVTIFRESQETSLRILRHICRDLARLIPNLSSSHSNNKPAMKELIVLFVAMDIGVRTRQIGEDDMRQIKNTLIRDMLSRSRNDENESGVSKLTQFARKFENVYFQSDLLTEGILIDMMIYGIYDKNKIRNSLKQSRYFVIPEEERPWKVVIRFDEFSDEVIEEALRDMRSQLDQLEIVESGEILHTFSLLMLMSFNGRLEEDISSLVDKAKAYIDQILESNKLSPHAFYDYEHERLQESYGGYVYWIRDEYRDEFREIYDHLLKARQQALASQLPAWGQELLVLVREDRQRFFDLIVNSHDGDRPYARLPVLREISEEDFVEAWLSEDMKTRRLVSRALERRYEWASSSGELAAEGEWAAGVCQLMEAKAAELNGYRGMRIRRLIPDSLRRVGETLEVQTISQS